MDLDHSNLKVFVAKPEYLLAMKCLAMRLPLFGRGFKGQRGLNLVQGFEFGGIVALFHSVRKQRIKVLQRVELEH